MINLLSSPAKGWESIKNGTFIKDYSYGFLPRDTRTALQKAIDKNDPYVRFERKKTLEDGDLQMKLENYENESWQPFEIYTATKVVNNGYRIEVRELRKGEWIYYKRERNNIINAVLDKRVKFQKSNNKGK